MKHKDPRHVRPRSQRSRSSRFISSGPHRRHRRVAIKVSRDVKKQLVEIAGRRDERGVTRVVREAIDAYIGATSEERVRREELLALGGSLSKEEADRLRASVQRSRESWER